MDLYYTPLSHYARKVRVLLDLYKAPYTLINIKNVAETNLSLFENNPLMKIPVLRHEDEWIIDSDSIAHFIVQALDPSDRYNVLSPTIDDMNFRAILNGIMDAEVKYILAKRTGIPVADYPFFDKALLTISRGLEWIDEWLEQNLNTTTDSSLHYKDIHLICAWEHLEHSNIIELNYPNIKAHISQLAQLDEIASSSPKNI